MTTSETIRVGLPTSKPKLNKPASVLQAIEISCSCSCIILAPFYVLALLCVVVYREIIKEFGPKEGFQKTQKTQKIVYLKGRRLISKKYTFKRLAVHFPVHDTNMYYCYTQISIERLSGQYGSCDDGSVFESRYALNYSRRACQTVCGIQKVINACNCFENKAEEFSRKINDTLRPCRGERGWFI